MPKGMEQLTNFGGNHTWSAARVAQPMCDADVLQILHAHRGERVRAIGRLHSWGPALPHQGVVVDLRELRAITLNEAEEWVEVGAGCQIKSLLAFLRRRGFTLPAVGLIDEQTVAGATATGTHGSGNYCLSQFILAARVACYHDQQPVLRTLDHGPELAAIRCSLGALGIIVSIRLRVRRMFRVEEFFRGYATLAEVLAQEEHYPLQQFYYLPWRWDFFAQHRREVHAPTSRTALLYRLYWVIGMDVGLHLVVRALVRWLAPRWTKVFFRHVLTWLVPRPWRVVDEAARQMTMQHELFRHIEIEMFVRRSHLEAALNDVRTLLEQHDTAGIYQHHYPICIREVLADDSLITMTNGWDEPGYAISLISYNKPSQRDGFFAFADELARLLATRYDARPHWGKYHTLPSHELVRLYPQIGTWARLAHEHDPDGTFTNPWLRDLLQTARLEEVCSNSP